MDNNIHTTDLFVILPDDNFIVLPSCGGDIDIFRYDIFGGGIMGC